MGILYRTSFFIMVLDIYYLITNIHRLKSFNTHIQQYIMEHQDWNTIVLRRNSVKNSKSDSHSHSNSGNFSLKIETMDNTDAPKKRLESESIQSLIRKRIDMKLTQDKADQLCNFPKNTVKNLEAFRAVPTIGQHSVIQKQFGVQLRIVTV